MNYHRLLGMLPGLNQGVDLWRFQAGSDADIDMATAIGNLNTHTPTPRCINPMKSRRSIGFWPIGWYFVANMASPTEITVSQFSYLEKPRFTKAFKRPN